MAEQQDLQHARVTVRPALESDADWCVDQLKDFANFFGSQKSLFGDRDFAIQSFRNKIKNHVVYVAERDGSLVGFISGYITPHPYNPQITVLTESFWWVPPEHRGSRAGFLLFKNFVEFGKENCDWVVTTIGSRTPVNDAFLLRQGFALKEKSYILEVK